MAILTYDGFDNYTDRSEPVFTSKWTATAGVSFTALNGGKNSYGRAMTCNGSIGNITSAQIAITGSTSISIGFDYQYQSVLASATSAGTLLLVADDIGGSPIRITITQNIYSMFWVYNIIDSTGAIIASSSRLYNFNISGWHNMELELVGSSTAGQIRLYIDGAKIIDVANSNTLAIGRTYRAVALYSAAWSSGNTNTLYDNFYVTNTSTRLGEPIVRSIRPNADTAQKQWIPSIGTTNFDKVNTTGYSNSQTTNVSSVINSNDSYTMADMPTGISTSKILAVSPKMLSYKGAIGQAFANSYLKINNNISQQPAYTPYESQSTSTLSPTVIYETNPFSGSAWTAANVTALQMGIMNYQYPNPVFAISSGQISNMSNSTLVSNTSTNDGTSLLFNGSQIVRYTDSADFNVTAPYSVEFEFLSTTSASVRVIMTIGQTSGINPELQFEIGSTNIMRALMYSASTGGASRQGLDMINPISSNTWYKIGFMLYNSGGLRARCYVNGVQVIDQSVVQPWNSTAGFCIGGDNTPANYFTGSVRNLIMGKSLFWPV